MSVANHGSFPTPLLAIQHAALVANLESMARRIEALGGVGTAHLKTHKSLEIAGMQLAAGARAATVATVAEAEPAIAAGFGRVLVAYPPVPRARVEALARLTDPAQVDVVCRAARPGPGAQIFSGTREPHRGRAVLAGLRGGVVYSARPRVCR